MSSWCEGSEAQLLLISLAFMTTVLSLSSYLKNYFKQNLDDSQKGFALVFLTLMESTALSWEMQVVTKKYGLPMYFFLQFGLRIWWNLTRSSVKSSAEDVLEETVNEETNLGEALFFIVSQLMGGFLGYWVTKSFWMLHLTKEHTAKCCEICVAGPKVRMFEAMVIEGVGVAINKIAVKGSESLDHVTAAVINTIVLMYTVMTAMDYTGAYFSASFATAMMFGCKNFKPLEHLVVYWIGPIMGNFAAAYVLENYSKEQI